MKLAELAILYLFVGTGAAAMVFVRRGMSAGGILDAGLLFTFWPLYGPFLLLQAGGDLADAPPSELLIALQRARGTPMACLLPDEATGRALAARLRVAAGKIIEIDELLTQPEFSETQALERHEELTRTGNSGVAATTLRRVQNIRRLRALRDRYSGELDQVGELMKQLRIQAEVVRLAGAPESGVRELVQELMARVEGLDEMLDLEGQP